MTDTRQREKRKGWPPLKGFACWEPGYKPTKKDREMLRQLMWAVYDKRKKLFKKGK